MEDLVNRILTTHCHGQFANLHELLNEAPSFKRMESLECDESDRFFDAVRRAEIEHKGISHREYLFTALTIDDAAEETGMHPDERVTCHSCKAWADHSH